MAASLALLPLGAPTLYLLAAFMGFLRPGIRPRQTLWAARIASLGALAAAMACAVITWQTGAFTASFPATGLFAASVRSDALSLTMLTLVTFVGALVVQFSRNYLEGDPRQGRFFAYLCLTLAAVSLLVTAGGLIHLLVAWIATSLALHKLLIFYAGRPRARVAARKKFLFARLGDALLLVAVVVLIQTFSTGDIATITETVRTGRADAASSGSIALAAGLIAAAGLLKSAQFPTHGWLIEVMETPTPVSALLHAGIVNAGGFLVVRFADLIAAAPVALFLLAIAGTVTALLAAAVRTTQTSIKVSLAWSTVAQMGFMMMQCGFGAFSSAVLHIVAHSLYKAHAFLASGSAADVLRTKRRLGTGQPGPAAVAMALPAALVLFAAIGAVLDVGVTDKPAIVALGAILVLGLAPLLAEAVSDAPPPRAALTLFAATVGVALLYFSLQKAALALIAPVAPTVAPLPPGMAAIMGLTVLGFAVAALAPLCAGAVPENARWRIYVLLSNGFYANAVTNRLIGGLRRPGSQQS